MSSSGTTVTGTGTTFQVQLHVGDEIIVDGQTRTVTTVTNATVLTVNSAFEPAITTAPYTFVTRALLIKEGNIGVGTASPANRLHVDKGRVDITTSDAPTSNGSGGQNRFNGLLGWNDDSTYRRGQLVISSSFSDLVIASSHDNAKHGSTLTLAAYNPANANEFRKWVINQGNWGTSSGSRKQFLDFGYSKDTSQSNPHASINETDTILTLDGDNKRVGIGTMNPSTTLEVSGSIKLNHLVVSGSNQDQTGTGTISSSGTAVTGVGTKFQTQLHIGDYLTIIVDSNKQTRMVTGISNDTALTVDSAFFSSSNISSNIAGASFTFTFLTPTFGLEKLRILRGMIKKDGSVLEGQGIFSAQLVNDNSSPRTGFYSVSFIPAFSNKPAVFVQALLEKERTQSNLGSYDYRNIATIIDLTESSMNVVLVKPDGTNIDSMFCVLAIGP